MSGDLNEFLRQAAARREARKRAEGTKPPPQSPPKASVPAPTEKSSPPTPKVYAEKRPENAFEISDKQREVHRQQVFETNHEASFAKAPQKASTKNKPSSSKPTSTTNKISSPRDQSQSVQSQASRSTAASSHMPSDPKKLLEILRDPDSLRIAFIASEIFQRKFD